MSMKENHMTTIYLIRHAEAEGNLYRRAHGWYNSTITDRGYRSPRSQSALPIQNSTPFIQATVSAR